jgi:aspartyl aminopeptidase
MFVFTFASKLRPICGTRSFSMRLPTMNSMNGKCDDITSLTNRMERCMNFINNSPEPYHCVSTVSEMLKENGFQLLNEDDLWRANNRLEKGGRYYFTRNKSSIVAFTVGKKYEAGNGFKVIGAHTDSPNLRVKPHSNKKGHGCEQIAVQTYGGGIWSTWFDRDLSVAGRVILRDEEKGYHTKLVKIDEPILRIPSLCIHLRTAKERDAMEINKETHLVPIICSEIKKELEKIDNQDVTHHNTIDTDPWKSSQQPELIKILADRLDVSPESIVDFDLSLYDTHKCSVSGSRGEYLCGSRLDNLASCFVAVETLIDYSTDKNIDEDSEVCLIALFDHEEVGSSSNTGAGSTIMVDSVARINNCFIAGGEDSELYKVSVAKSMIFSVDMAHAIHPNYAAKHELGHSPLMNAGIVIKSNANQRYSTTGITGFLTRELARGAKIPVQEFVVRNDW